MNVSIDSLSSQSERPYLCPHSILEGRERAIHNVAKKIPWDVLDQASHFLGLYDPVRWNGRPNPPLMSDCKGLESEVIRRMVKLVFSMPNIKSSFMCQMNPLISLSMSLFLVPNLSGSGP